MKNILLILLFPFIINAGALRFFNIQPNSAFSDLKSLEFVRANSSYVDFGNNSALNFTGATAFSISAWIYPTAASSGYCSILGKWTGGSDTGWDFNSNGNGTLELDLINGGGAQRLRMLVSYTFSLNTWYHVVATYDGSKTPSGVKLYINGTSQTLTTAQNNLSSTIANSETVKMGYRLNGGSYANRIQDETSVWNKVLSSSDIAELKTAAGGPSNLATTSFYANGISWWRLGDSPDTYTTINDRIGNATGTTSGMSSGSVTTNVPTGVW